MNKVMMALATAALSASVFAADGITSANIVGYANQDLRSGYKMMTAMFSSINKEGIKLSDLTVTGYPEYKVWTDVGTAGEVVIKVLNYMGGTAVDEDGNKMEYFYYDTLATDPNYGGQGAGWYTESAGKKVDAESIVFEVGQGLWVAGQDKYTVLCNGQVLTGNATVALRNGYVSVGNPYATKIKLSSITVTGYPEYKTWTDVGTGGEVVIKVLNYMGGTAVDEDGNKMEYFYYDTLATDSNYGGQGAGWYTESAGKKLDADTIEFAAGDGLWVAGKDGYYLNFKTPITIE